LGRFHEPALLDDVVARVAFWNRDAAFVAARAGAAFAGDVFAGDVVPVDEAERIVFAERPFDFAPAAFFAFVVTFAAAVFVAAVFAVGFVVAFVAFEGALRVAISRTRVASDGPAISTTSHLSPSRR
jgi:hypothetical protein